MIGIVPPPDDPRFGEAILVAYALSRIKDKKDCEDTKSRFAADATAIGAIEATYDYLGEDCSADEPGKDAREKASELLRGLKVR
ncbi:MAG: hypothetical protein ACE5PT_05130 [Gemmatimonadales bacterium]